MVVQGEVGDALRAIFKEGLDHGDLSGVVEGAEAWVISTVVGLDYVSQYSH